LILKGGTAINLIYTHLKRLSVDIDLDYHGSLLKEEAFIDREIISKELNSYMIREGYEISKKSRESVALFSRLFKYKTASGNLDYIKVEINFMDRISIYPITSSTIRYFDKEFDILTPRLEELFAMKIAALIDRSKPRDLYDCLYILENNKCFNSEKIKKAVVFYISLDGIFNIDNLLFEKIRTINVKDIKTELTPVLKKGEKFNLDENSNNVILYLSNLLVLNQEEKEYLRLFANGKYEPSLLFDEIAANNANNHPMAKWKINNIKKKNS